jgi:hypothetical protein
MTLKVMAKLARAYHKAGIIPTEEQAAALLDQLVSIGVPVEHRGSSRIAKVIKGAKPIESLLVEDKRGRKSNA